MDFKRIAHVCLHVSDLQRSLAYYAKLGFTEVFHFTRKGRDFGRYLRVADQCYLEIFEEAGRGPVVNNGIAHFCLETDDLEGLMAHLDAQGVAYTPAKLGGDFTWQIWLQDPDGNKFEVHRYTDQSMQLLGGTMEADW
ncbi:catechol 2,3-dioxygenase-like lactoylglutathione lyase family enzyme [Pelomonas saccharophila]|jgi:lactoylglutathione lyase|uniref:Catechol 2,3-dioxygenase-like lactoylglutathione lyase family enzyme n=1 Tax=Roseateles saccharophilus TaxID=304 RepID=A0ABU1YFJ5_ROSSA|nr:VOC family protein [Roseateles saccharophilus]MDR7267508.1 catechol 2,3-dioxygenase-like lactoylglutathione lyase family enzyme [Roseateles saccharophilus]